MKKIIFPLSLISILLIMSCDNAREVTDKDEELRKIENILEQYVVANENQDFSIIEAIWANNNDIILIGTDSDESLIGWEQIKNAINKQFESFESTYISVTEQYIKINETCNTAWFAEELSYNFIYKGEAKSYEGIRFTGVLEKANDNWKLIQGHLSIPAEVDIEQE